MTQQVKTRKAKRNLKDINFEGDKSHIALVTAEGNGGPANGEPDALILKANRSEEFLQKASQVSVTLEITEYLRRFYGLWYDDAEVLARALGFTTAQMDEEAADAIEEAAVAAAGITEDDCCDYQSWIEQRVQSISIMKSVFEADNKIEALANLTEEQYLSLLQDQEIVEKAVLDIEKGCGKKPNPKAESDDVASATDSDTSTIVDVEKSVEASASVNTVVTKPEEQVEVIKAKFEVIEKAFNEQKVQLEKAQKVIAEYEAAQKAAIIKSRKAALFNAVKDNERTEVLFKAVGLIEDQATFDEVVKSLAEMQAVVDSSDLFIEKGAELEEEQPKVKTAAEILKARLTNK